MILKEEILTHFGDEDIPITIKRFSDEEGEHRICIRFDRLNIVCWVSYNGSIDLRWDDAHKIMNSYFNYYGGCRHIYS